MFRDTGPLKITVAQALRGGQAWTIRCLAPRCRRVRRLEADDPWWSQWPASASLSVIEAFAVCSTCRHQGCELQAASPEGPGGLSKPKPAWQTARGDD